MNRLHVGVARAVYACAAVLAPLSAMAASPGETAIAQAASEQKFAFVLFHKQNDAATDAVAKTLSAELAKRDDAVAFYIDAGDAAEKAIVDKYKVGRAPMPLTLVLAPNGAVTGIFSQKISAAQIKQAFVTPKTATCMKSMQDGKLVLLCVDGAGAATIPAGVHQFRNDPEFKSRVVLVSVEANDAAEAPFLAELEIDAAKLRGTAVVFMAPPGAMVGKYDAKVSKDQLATDLHAAGKCCDDPNCKHNKKAN
jgi:hypothetical protein